MVSVTITAAYSESAPYKLATTGAFVITGIAACKINTCFINKGILVGVTSMYIIRGARINLPNNNKRLSFPIEILLSPALEIEIPIKIIDNGIVKLPRYNKSELTNVGNFTFNNTKITPTINPNNGGENILPNVLFKSKAVFLSPSLWIK